MKSDAWAAWVAAARPNIEGFTVDAIVIPASSQDKGGFARDTWVFQLTRKGFSPRALWISLKAQHCGIALLEGKGPAKAPKATLPVFLQKLKKEWIGKRITAVSVYPQERFIRMVAGSELVLIMIPAKPDAYWRDVSTQVNLQYRKNTKLKFLWSHK